MSLNITFRGIEPSEALKSHVRERIDHLTRYLDRAVESHVVLFLERYLQHADFSIQAGSFLLRGKAKSEDMYKSIDEAIDKIERQLKRYKGRLRSHKQRDRVQNRLARHEVLEVQAPEHDTQEAPLPTPKIVRSNEFPVQSLSIDEASMQMDLMNNEFLVFINSETSKAAVIYRRKDGLLGLLET